MNGHFISRSGTRHVIGGVPGKLHGGRVVGLCGFSQRGDDEDLPAEARQECAWCQTKLARALARQRAETPAENILPQQDPETAA
jgi:hypothetical protein